MRHAKSSWSHDLTDYERPLNGRGKQNAPMMGEHLKAQGRTPDLVLCSSAKRARQTAKAVHAASGCETELIQVEDFYLAEPDVYIEALSERNSAADVILVVGHNPGVAELLEILTGDFDAYPTGTIAEIELPIANWAALSDETAGTLKNLWKPRFLS